jgi:hypothetical protein
MVNLFYSEYAEGSSNNKYFEIYNPSSEAVNLSDYRYNSCSNDCNYWEYSTAFAEGAIIPAGGTYSVCHPSFAGDQSLCDQLTTLYFNGNDAQGLIYVTTGEILDVIGDTIGSAEYWSVAGVSSGTRDQTLVRKCGITQGNADWTASAGSNSDDSEWLVFDNETWDYLGTHTVECVSGCTDSEADNYNINATSDDGSCEYSGCTDSTANNYDANANVDDGSCDYTVITYYSLTVSVDMNIEGFSGDNMTVRLDGGEWLAMTDLGDNVWSYTFTTLLPGDFTYNFYDGSYESSSNLGSCATGNFGNDRTATIVDSNVTVPTVCWESCTVCPELILGCTDSDADNYNINANSDDGSCVYSGCTDSTAVNYNSSATSDDGSVVLKLYKHDPSSDVADEL